MKFEKNCWHRKHDHPAAVTLLAGGWPQKAIASSQRRSVADLQDFEPAIENRQSRVEERDVAPDAKVYRLTRRAVLNQIRRFRNATQQSASNMAVFPFMSNS